ncbi:signal transduction histidine kinase [Nocardia sp. GAS34]
MVAQKQLQLPDASGAEVGLRSLRARLVSLLLGPTAPPLAPGIAVAAGFIVAETLVVYLLNTRVAPHVQFGQVYLLGVVVVAAGWGLGLTVITSVASSLAFICFQNWPAVSSLPIRAYDWVVIAISLVVALSAHTLAGLARTRAADADRRRREAEESRDQLRVLAEQQAALRRVATLVARAATSCEVFPAVAEELARCLGVHFAALWRYQPDGTAIVVAARDEPGVTNMPVGTRFSLEGESVPAMVLRTGRPARVDSYENAAGSTAVRIRELGLRGAVGAPIVVNGRVWGAAIVGSSRPEPLPPDTEARVADFTDLVATAIANAEAHAELTASRARIVAAADDARRRIERDLHDGAQQRLVSLGLELRSAEASVPTELDALRGQISHIVSGLTGVSEDLQEISRGIHPAILSKGLGPALKTLARRSTVPVELDLHVDRRLPESAEVTAYYVAAEALTNSAKHAQASQVNARVEADRATLRLSIRDDGIGGADICRGSGIVGLIDRVEALGGRMEIASPAGDGTSLLATIPL